MKMYMYMYMYVSKTKMAAIQNILKETSPSLHVPGSASSDLSQIWVDPGGKLLECTL